MKRFLLLSIAFFGIQVVAAQTTTAEIKQDTYNLSNIDLKPDFPGGIQEFYKFIGKNYIIPNVKNLSGKVYMTFVIEIDGKLGDIKIIRDLGYGTGEEAIRVLSLCPNWVPGELSGKKVRVLYALPIAINIK
jgi:Gram-negative bacterial TonB protein C-terminal